MVNKSKLIKELKDIWSIELDTIELKKLNSKQIQALIDYKKDGCKDWKSVEEKLNKLKDD
jgi:hypothetical protein